MVNRVEQQVEGSRLGGLLLVADQAGDAVGESVGDAEVHQPCLRGLGTFPCLQRDDYIPKR